MKFKKFFIFLPAIAFLIVAVLTIKDYGLNTDEPFHFNRGQDYFHFFLTGRKDFEDLKPYPRLGDDSCKTGYSEKCTSPTFPDDVGPFKNVNFTYEDAIKIKYKSGQWGSTRSYFESDGLNFNEVVKEENGHPPFGGTVASLFNFVFYQKLGILGDIESYHLAEIAISAVGIAAVSVFCYLNFGLFTAAVASSVIALSPLFFAEAHFNIKDPIECAFLGMTIILFYFGVVKRRWSLIVGSAVVTGLALETKFNALFLPFIVVPWLIFEIVNFVKKKEKINKNITLLIVSLVIYPFITLAVFYILWPYLWPNPLVNVQSTIGFYKTIGTGTPGELSRFIFKKFDFFAPVWILLTTPLITLFLSAAGVLASAVEYLKTRKTVYILLSLWLIVPIARVVFPGSAIYGGVRQIMEFIFPLAIFAGLGAAKLLKRGRIFFFLIIVALLSYPIIKYHPNENVYFNEIAGGLSGAKQAHIPYWGNTYGNIYLQGVNWLNKNAEPDARLGLPIGTMANIPRLKLRSDIKFNNAYWSGTGRKGEYEMEQIYDYPQLAWYSYQYYDTYLNPVYEVKVDGVTLLKIWKNDLEHTKKGFDEEALYPFKIITNKDGKVNLDLGKQVSLTRVEISHATSGCDQQKGGTISISLDGKSWFAEPEAIDYPQVPPDAVGWTNNNFVFLFPAKAARYISLNTQMKNSCYLKNPKITVWGLKAD